MSEKGRQRGRERSSPVSGSPSGDDMDRSPLATSLSSNVNDDCRNFIEITERRERPTSVTTILRRPDVSEGKGLITN